MKPMPLWLFGALFVVGSVAGMTLYYLMQWALGVMIE